MRVPFGLVPGPNAFNSQVKIRYLLDPETQLRGVDDADPRTVYPRSIIVGDRHRFTLLRAALAMEALLRRALHWFFDVPPEKRSIRSKHDGATIATDQEARREWWLSQSLQRYFLFCIAMDTAVKIASSVAQPDGLRKRTRNEVFPSCS